MSTVPACLITALIRGTMPCTIFTTLYIDPLPLWAMSLGKGKRV